MKKLTFVFGCDIKSTTITDNQCETAINTMCFIESFKCHNVTIMKNAQGDRVIIQEVK